MITLSYAKSVAEESNIDISDLKLDQVSQKKLKSVEKLMKLKLNHVYKKLADDKFEKIDQTSQSGALLKQANKFSFMK